MNSRLALSAESIVDEALSLIRSEGHSALSMRALAGRMGVTAPAFYDHFSSRDDLLRACAQAGYGVLNDRFEAAAPATAIALAWQASRIYVSFALDEPQLFRLMFLFRPGSIEIDADNELPAATTLFDTMVGNLGQAIADGDLGPGDPAEYGIALWAAVHGVATVALLIPDLDAEKLTDQVVGPMLRGWATPP